LIFSPEKAVGRLCCLVMVPVIASMMYLAPIWPGEAPRPSILAVQHGQNEPTDALVLVHGVATLKIHPECVSVLPDGTGYRVLASSVDPYDPYAGYNPICNDMFIAALSPDGSRWLGVTWYPIDGNPDKAYDIYLEVRDGDGKNPIALVSDVPDQLGHPSWHWQATWMPDSQHVLFWDQDYTDEDRGPDFSGYLDTGRLRLLGMAPVTDTLLAVFSDGETWPVITITPDGLPALAVAPDGERVLFRSGNPDSMGLYSIHTDGSGVDTLVDSGRVGGCVSWSPDGSRIVFEHWQDSSPTIQVINPDGSGQMTLAEGRRPAWSPDGQQIAFDCSGENEMPGICVVSPDVAHLQVLPTGYVGEVHSPYWSPDGSSIAFIGKPAAQPDDDSPFETYDLNVYDFTTGQTVKLMSHEAPYAVGCGGNSAPIQWSTDGEWILYEVIVPMMHCGAVEGGGTLWYVCDREGCRELGEVAGVGAVRHVRWKPVR
jgi:WD40 repeat protein